MHGQADAWNVYPEYVKTVHEIYEATRYDEVQELNRLVSGFWED